MTAVAQAAGCLGIRANDINSARVLETDGECVRVQVQYAHGKVLDHTFDAKDWADHEIVERAQSESFTTGSIADVTIDPPEFRIPDPEPLPPKRVKTAKKKRARKKAAKKRKTK